MARLIVGTAGHIDHGKTSLVRALTGTDPDRLPEEKKRGITIDLGFAFLDELAAIIDVPGHERFIKNMVAGAATIDFAILVVAADDGVMPQTREHLHILRLLGVEHGVVVLTKTDVPDPEWINLVEDQIRKTVRSTFLEQAACYRVDSISGRGIPEFRAALITHLTQLSPRAGRGIFRLPIDRVFSVKGRGAVVTGTVVSGTVQPESEVCIFPDNIKLRVKQLESHGQAAVQVQPGQRAALNLQGETELLRRGQTIGPVRGLFSTQRIAARIELLDNCGEIKERQRVRFLIGTQEALGRLQVIHREADRVLWANVMMEEPVVAAWSDRFILRQYSPLDTLGGGVTIDPDPPQLRARSAGFELPHLQKLYVKDLAQAVVAYVETRRRSDIDSTHLAALFAAAPPDVDTICAASEKLTRLAGRWFALDYVASLEVGLIAALKAAFEKSSGQVGYSPLSLRTGLLDALPEQVFDGLVQRLIDTGKIVREGGLLRFPERTIAVTAQQEKLMAQVAQRLSVAGFAPPNADVLAEELKTSKVEIGKVLVLMERLGKAKRLGLDLFFDSTHFDRSVEALVDALAARQQLAVADVSALLNSSRKYVVPLLEFLDEKGITRRDGNVRYPGRNFAHYSAPKSA